MLPLIRPVCQPAVAFKFASKGMLAYLGNYGGIFACLHVTHAHVAHTACRRGCRLIGPNIKDEDVRVCCLACMANWLFDQARLVALPPPGT